MITLHFVDGSAEKVVLTYAEWAKVYVSGEFRGKPLAKASIDSHEITFERPPTDLKPL